MHMYSIDLFLYCFFTISSFDTDSLVLLNPNLTVGGSLQSVPSPGTRGLFLLGDLLKSPDLCARASWLRLAVQQLI